MAQLNLEIVSGCGCGKRIHLNRGRRLHERLHRVGFLRVNDERRGLRRCIRHRQATDGHFVRRLADDRAVRQLLLVRAGLEASQQRHLVAHLVDNAVRRGVFKLVLERIRVIRAVRRIRVSVLFVRILCVRFWHRLSNGNAS